MDEAYLFESLDDALEELRKAKHSSVLTNDEKTAIAKIQSDIDVVIKNLNLRLYGEG